MGRARDDVKEILDYIHKNLKKGYKIDALKWALIKQGYSRTAISDAFEIIEESRAKEDKERKEAEVLKAVEEMPVIEEKKSFWKRVFG